MTTVEPIVDRFFRHVEKSSGCWNWIGSTSSAGYGQFRVEGRLRQAHRVAWLLTIGPIPDDLTLDHICRNRRCVSPAHLEPVTLRENILRSRSPSAQNARKTHCIRGHELPPDRICRSCQEVRRRESGVLPRARPTHCPQGHAYTPENTKEGSSGIQCRACARDYYHRTKRTETGRDT